MGQARGSPHYTALLYANDSSHGDTFSRSLLHVGVEPQRAAQTERRYTPMTHRSSLPLLGCLMAVAPILQLLQPVASGAVGVGGLPAPGNGNRAVHAAAQNTSPNGNPNPGVHPPNSNPYGLS